MKDNQIKTTIDDLVAEEHQLREQHEQTPLNEDDLNRLRAIEESLDQCWDLLRQRRARREYGQDPDQASARSRNVVEGYRQ
ncbi:MAG TPA: DUF2630 family protein [Acidimicrobiales bacterium]|nr:DUF2630 family protein [Acidimicrobiales bacterium]